MSDNPFEERASLQGRLARRSVLRGGGLLIGGVAAAALIGCGSDDEEQAPPSATSSAAASTAPGKGELIRDNALPYPYQFPEPNKVPKAGGTMVLGVNSDVSIMDPQKTTASGTGRIVNLVYNRLLGYNRGVRLHPFKFAIEGELAKSWEQSPDGLVYTFKLQDGVKWQNIAPLNGRPFVADDVKFAFDRYKSGGISTSYWVGVQTIEAPDPKTVKITLKKPLADFLTPLGSAYQTIHPKELVDSGEIEKKAVGTGPMILKDAIVGQKVTFEKNPEYWEGKVLLDGVEFRLQVDTPARLAAFRSGQTDFGDILVTNITDAKALESTNQGVQINMSSVVLASGFAMNLSNPKFQDVRVRRAISLGIDRQALANLVYPGIGKILPMHPWIFHLDKEPTTDSFGQWHQFNPNDATKLLAAAGASNLELQNKYYPYSQAYEQTNDVMVDQLRKVGVNLVGGKVEYTEYNSQWTGRKLPEVSTGGWVTIGFDADNYYYNCMHSSAAGNRWNLNDPKVDDLASRQQSEVNPQKRKDLLKQIYEYDLDQAYHPIMATGVGFYAYQPWLHGIRFGGAMGTSNNYQDIGDMIMDAWIDK
ncbi:MAG: ABC transporter substrate-binding protein [Dehalococcoidia bacterium]|nr:ABC transporter substrate-binding protein [Dehalococcoidia bacterium]HRC62070.1 ABC transporter substrate-binding protein [Dehalococcoidia bacterium]